MNDWPGNWRSGREKQLATAATEQREGAALFNDHGVLYLTEDERSDKWLWMEDRPDRLENRC